MTHPHKKEGVFTQLTQDRTPARSGKPQEHRDRRWTRQIQTGDKSAFEAELEQSPRPFASRSLIAPLRRPCVCGRAVVRPCGGEGRCPFCDSDLPIGGLQGGLVDVLRNLRVQPIVFLHPLSDPCPATMHLRTACATCRRYVRPPNRNSRSGLPVSNGTLHSFNRLPHPCCYDRTDPFDRRVVPDSLLHC